MKDLETILICFPFKFMKSEDYSTPVVYLKNKKKQIMTIKKIDGNIYIFVYLNFI